jgi:hypothetical protein
MNLMNLMKCLESHRLRGASVRRIDLMAAAVIAPSDRWEFRREHRYSRSVKQLHHFPHVLCWTPSRLLTNSPNLIVQYHSHGELMP